MPATRSGSCRCPCRSGANHDGSDGARSLRGNLVTGISHLDMHGLCVAQQRNPKRCQRDAARQALEQFDSELLLEQPDAFGERRLRDVKLGRGKGDVLALCHTQEVFELPKVHRCS